MTTVTWTQLLDDYESAIALLERSMTSGTPPELPPWQPPPPPRRTPEEEERDRFRRLQARAVACRLAVEEQLTVAGRDLAGVRRTDRAARAYGAQAG